jgi:hypothetical protein
MQKRELPKEHIEWQLQPLPADGSAEPPANQPPPVDLSALGQDQLLDLFAAGSTDLPLDLLGESMSPENMPDILGGLDSGNGPTTPPK